MSDQSKALQSVCTYIAKVTNEVRGRLEAGKVPSPEQLANYVKQVVDQLQKLIKGAPRNIQDKMAEPFKGFYDFWGNSTKKPLSAQSFLGILEDLEDAFPMPSNGGGEEAPEAKGAARQEAPKGKGGAPAPAAPAASAAPAAPASKGAPAGKGAAPSGKGKAAESPAERPAPAPAPARPAAPASHGQHLFEAKKKHASDDGPAMRADAAAFLPGKGYVKETPEVPKSRRVSAPEMSEASKRMPTYEKKDWIIAGIRHNTVSIISGDTGCGKSTLIPQLVCDAESLVPDDKVVVCTQPRRVAAITLAEYVAKDRGQELGDEVGYQIRFINKFCESTRLIYATTAIVLRRLHSEPTLDSIGCLIIDEVHERDVYTDFLLLLLKEAMLNGHMPHLKVVLMSATVKAEDFANYFGQVNGQTALKPVKIPGRMFPVEDFYFEDACEWVSFCPADKGAGKGKGKKGGRDDGSVEDKIEACYQAIMNVDIPQVRPSKVRANDYSDKTLRACALWRECEVYVDLVEELVYYFHKTEPKGDGAILIFLPGWGDITKTFIRLYQSGENYKLITLHSLMTPEQQHEAFERPPKGTRKVVLSTNIAEASVTIDDVVYVIDTGVRKERSYDAGTGISSLDAKMVTKANAIQRRGRAGRCQEGLVVHLFPSFKFKDFEQFPIPQMLSSSMEEVVLQSKVIHGGSNSEISSMLTNSMAAPQPKAVDAAVKLLKDMSCLTRSGDLTVLGRAVAAIPVQPNVAKFLLIAAAFRCIKPAACVAAFLSIKSPFQQSVNESADKDKVTGKDYFNKGFASDHLTMIQAYVEWRREALRGRGDDFCDEQGLSPETLDMAFMMVQQFVSFMVDAGYDGPDVTGEGDYGEVDPVKKASDTDALLKAAMVAGFQPNICVLYRGQRSPYWYLDSNEEVSPFRGSANADYKMSGADGEEWMVFSDSMKMGRFNSIMDSSLVFSPFVLLFANAVMIDEKKGEIRFDKWYAYIQSGPWIKELLYLRSQIMPQFKEAMESRDIASFPMELVQRMTDFLRQRPIRLDKIEAVARSIDEEVRKTLTKKTSRKGSGNNKANKLRPEDVPVPDSDLEEEPAKRKTVKAVKDNGLSRGQRKRLQRRENFLRKFELAKVVQAQDEAKSGLDLSGLTDGLEEALETSSHVQQSLKRPGRKVQAAKDQREMKHFQNVLNFDAFKNDPFGALEQHLKNSIKLQKEEEVKQKVKPKQTKTPASAVKDKLKEQKRTGTKNAKSVKSVKGKFSKPKRHK